MFDEDLNGSWPEPAKGDVVALIAGFVSGQSLQEIASATGLSISTVQRRRRDPQVQQAVRAAQQDQRRQVGGRLAAIRSDALEVLADLLKAEDPKVRLSAAGVVLTQALRYDRIPEPEPAPEHTTGADVGADLMLSRQMAPDAWDLEPADPVTEDGADTQTDLSDEDMDGHERLASARVQGVDPERAAYEAWADAMASRSDVPGVNSSGLSGRVADDGGGGELGVEPIELDDHAAEAVVPDRGSYNSRRIDPHGGRLAGDAEGTERGEMTNDDAQ